MHAAEAMLTTDPSTQSSPVQSSPGRRTLVVVDRQLVGVHACPLQFRSCCAFVVVCMLCGWPGCVAHDCVGVASPQLKTEGAPAQTGRAGADKNNKAAARNASRGRAAARRTVRAARRAARAAVAALASLRADIHDQAQAALLLLLPLLLLGRRRGRRRRRRRGRHGRGADARRAGAAAASAAASAVADRRPPV